MLNNLNKFNLNKLMLNNLNKYVKMLLAMKNLILPIAKHELIKNLHYISKHKKMEI